MTTTQGTPCPECGSPIGHACRCDPGHIGFIVIATFVAVMVTIANVMSLWGLSDTLESINVMPHRAAEAFTVIWGVIGLASLVLMVVLLVSRAHWHLWSSAGALAGAAVVGAALNWVIMIIILMSV